MDFSNWVNELLESAKQVALKGYAPFSGLKVGCAILTNNGRRFDGVNVESDSYGLSLCAERSALANMITHRAEGEYIKAIAIYAEGNNPCYPCGACRQFLLPFCTTESHLIVLEADGKVISVPLLELLPRPFQLKSES